MSFNFNELSLKRTQLMGVATLMILLCHASASNVLMPHWLKMLFVLGNYGVDVFLVLSGLGLFYSLSRSPITSRGGVVTYCKRRFYRIFIPYGFIFIPYCLIFLFLGIYTIADSLLCITALEYWFYHRGAWFVSLIIFLYIVAPLLYKLLSNDIGFVSRKWYEAERCTSAAE